MQPDPTELASQASQKLSWDLKYSSLLGNYNNPKSIFDGEHLVGNVADKLYS